MRGFIANTDFGWFSHFLHRAEPPDEVDFWQSRRARRSSFVSARRTMLHLICRMTRVTTPLHLQKHADSSSFCKQNGRYARYIAFHRELAG